MTVLFLFGLFSLALAKLYKYSNINYKYFTIIHVNHSIDNIINYSYNDIDNNMVDIDHHINMYSLFTQSYFNNCLDSDPYCNYNLYDQEIACHHALKHEGGQLYYHGVYTDEYIDMEIMGNGNQRESRKINRIYEIKGMYIIQDLTNDEKLKKHRMCTNENYIKTYKYSSEPSNFYRKMMIYILLNNNTNIKQFCPLWAFHHAL